MGVPTDYEACPASVAQAGIIFWADSHGPTHVWEYTPLIVGALRNQARRREGRVGYKKNHKKQIKKKPVEQAARVVSLYIDIFNLNNGKILI